MSTSSAKEAQPKERLEARVPASLKLLFQRAAAVQGVSLTDFILSAATEAARRVIRESEVLELSQRDQLALAKALLNPPKANARLKKAVSTYKTTKRTHPGK